MKITSTILAFALLSAVTYLAQANSLQGKLSGTWVATQQYKDYPRTILHFKGDKITCENMFEEPATVKYKVKEKDKKGTTIYFEYTHKVKRGNGSIIDRTEYMELLYHVEDGRPILSETVFEYDGRGLIIMGEFLRQDQDFVDGFESKLKKKLNSHEPVPMSR